MTNNYLNVLSEVHKKIDKFIEKPEIETWESEFPSLLELLKEAALLFNLGENKILWMNFWDKDHVINYLDLSNKNANFIKETEKLNNKHQKYVWKDPKSYGVNIRSSRNIFKEMSMANEVFQISFRNDANSIFQLLSVLKSDIVKINQNGKKSNDSIEDIYRESLEFIKTHCPIFINYKTDFLKSTNDKDFYKFINWVYWIVLAQGDEWTDSFYLDSTLFNDKMSNEELKKDDEQKKQLEKGILYCNIGCRIVNGDDIEICSFVYHVRNVLNKIRFIRERIEYEKIIKKAQIKSAIAAIMSRNMSHNLGSHILSGTKSEIANNNFNLDRKQVIGTYRLFQYIQERMDFLSVIINQESTHKEFNAPLNLKADILDEFAVDGRGERHKSSSDSSHSFLLSHIVSSEKITRESKNKDNLNIEIQILKKEKENNSILYKCFTSLANGDNNTNEFNEINFSVPLGVNSRHAFLTILENYIRNIAKHKTSEISTLIAINKNSNLDNKLVISILVEMPDMEILDEKKDKSDDKQRNCKITIFDNLPVKETDICDLNNRINIGTNCEYESDEYGIQNIKILNNDYSLNKYNKGLKEMLICVAWLKGATNDWSLIEQRNHNLMKYIQIPAVLYGQCGISKTNKTYAGIVFELPEHNFYYYKKIAFEEKIIEILAKLPSSEIYIIDFEDVNNMENKIHEIRATIPKVLFFESLKELSDDEITDIKNNANNKKLLDKLYSNMYKDKFADHKIIINYNCNIDSEKENSNLISRIGEGENYLPKLEEANIPIFFTAHNDSPEIFVKNINELIKNNLLNKIKFIEGISGGNFTYNLLCNAPIDRIQYFRILEAAFTKIAIIDERIYKRFKGISFGNLEKLSSSFTENEVEILKNMLKNYKEKAIDYDEILKRNNRLFERFLISIGVQNNIQSKREWIENNNVIELASNESCNKLWLRKKNLYIYNAHKIDNFKLADIDDNTIIKIEDVDFLSIHYGILEKLKFHENKDQFKIYLEKIGVDLTHTKICIHSGRGGVVQLQDDVTFIPLSSLDAQIDDSKYKLTQMFLNLNFKPF